MKGPSTHIILDMDSTLLSMECLDSVLETAFTTALEADAVKRAMQEVQREMDKGMDGKSPLTDTIPARIAIAKRLGTPLKKEYFTIISDTVASALSLSLVNALISIGKTHSLIITIVSGGPQECVDAAVKALQERLGEIDTKVTGVGSTIVLDDEGVYDQLGSSLISSKEEIVRELVEDPAHAIMVGDAATDVALYDSGAVHFFLAMGLWVQRDVLFARADNSPYYIKVTSAKEVEPALRSAIEAMY